jgi:hypothetical protein
MTTLIRRQAQLDDTSLARLGLDLARSVEQDRAGGKQCGSKGGGECNIGIGQREVRFPRSFPFLLSRRIDQFLLLLLLDSLVAKARKELKPPNAFARTTVQLSSSARSVRLLFSHFPSLLSPFLSSLLTVFYTGLAVSEKGNGALPLSSPRSSLRLTLLALCSDRHRLQEPRRH